MITLAGTTQKFLAVKQASPFSCDKNKYIVMYINKESDGTFNTEYAVHYYNAKIEGEFYTGHYTRNYADAMREFNSRGYCQS